MARTGGWRRKGRKGNFHYVNARGKKILDPEKVERIEALVIPPAWQRRLDLSAPESEAPGDRGRSRWPAPVPVPPGIPGAAGTGEVRQPRALRRATARLTEGDEQAHRRRATQRRVDVRSRDPAHQHGLVPRRHGALCANDSDVRDHDASQEATSRFEVAGSRSSTGGNTGSWFGQRLLDAELANALKTLRDLPGGGPSLSLRARGLRIRNLTGARFNEYIRQYMDEEFTAKDFRTWGGTLLAAIASRRKDVPETETEGKKKGCGGCHATWSVTSSETRRR